jgi:hypothetical protein
VNNKFFITGGSNINDVMNGFNMMGIHKYSDKAFILDTLSGVIEQKPRMSVKRQAHGMCLVGNSVYCCAGLDGYQILKSCERFNLDEN